jgi:hypothetical protein
MNRLAVAQCEHATGARTASTSFPGLLADPPDADTEWTPSIVVMGPVIRLYPRHVNTFMKTTFHYISITFENTLVTLRSRNRLSASALGGAPKAAGALAEENP